MADNYNIFKNCERCHGTGEIKTSLPNPPRIVEKTCPNCEGDGKVYWGEMLEQEPPE